MQLDAEDDEHAYYRPPVEPSASSATTGEAGDNRLSGETQVEAASVATTEDEE